MLNSLEKLHNIQFIQLGTSLQMSSLKVVLYDDVLLLVDVKINAQFSVQ
jgi:hypothetical protein